jgi:hypothetical protein
MQKILLLSALLFAQFLLAQENEKTEKLDEVTVEAQNKTITNKKLKNK